MQYKSVVSTALPAWAFVFPVNAASKPIDSYPVVATLRLTTELPS